MEESSDQRSDSSSLPLKWSCSSQLVPEGKLSAGLMQVKVVSRGDVAASIKTRFDSIRTCFSRALMGAATRKNPRSAASQGLRPVCDKQTQCDGEGD